MNKKMIIILLCILLVVTGMGCLCCYGIKKKDVPENWEGIFRGTLYINERNRVSIGVTIEEGDSRKISVQMIQSTGGTAMTFVSNSIELEKKRADSMTFYMNTGPEIPDIDIEDVLIFIKLKYIDENTIEIKYGNNEYEMEACEPIKLSRSVV